MRFDFLNTSKLFLANLFPSGLFHAHPNFRVAVINRKVVAMKKVTGTVIFPLFLYFFVILPCIFPNLQRLHTKLRLDGFTLICDVFIIPTCIQQ